MKKLTIPVILVLLILVACKTTKNTKMPDSTRASNVCDGTIFLYNNEIIPVMEQYCTCCQSDGGRGGYDSQLLMISKEQALTAI